MRGRSKNREDTAENEFLSQPNLNNSLLTTNKQPMQREQYMSKDQMIKNLQDRNQRLRAQLIKIQEVLDEKPEEEKKEHKLVPFEESEDLMRRQLQNAYKHIKNYEVEIRKLEEAQEGGLVTNRMQKFEQIFTEKAKHIDKLKGQIAQITKSSNDNAKKLKDNNLRDELEGQMLKLNEEIKFLRERVKDAEGREKMKQGNAKKQFDYIKKLEKELIEIGVSADELEEIKNRSNLKERADKAEREIGTANIADTKANEPEDLTVDRYLEIKNELKLLKKMQGDYEKKMEVLTKEKEDLAGKNLASRNKLLDCQNDIEDLEREIKELKTKVKPEHMRPTRSISTTENAMKAAAKVKRVATSVQKNKGTLAHILKHDEVGMTSDRGQRFTDRAILGKSTATRLIGLNVFLNKTTGLVCGIQSIYRLGERRKAGGEYLRKDKDLKDPYYELQSFECEADDYVKSITGTLNPTDHLEYINCVTSTGKSFKFGSLKTPTKQFAFDIAEDEVPSCMFGSLLIRAEPGKKENSVVEHIGFEIAAEAKQREAMPSAPLT